MKEIQGRASASVDARQEDCFSLLAAIDRYPEWNGELVREVQVLESDREGRPSTARAVLHVAQSPFGKGFELIVAARPEPPGRVHITRVPNEASDRERLDLVWRLHRNEPTTLIELDFRALVSFLPGFLPLGGVGDQIAQALVDAAASAVDSVRP